MHYALCIIIPDSCTSSAADIDNLGEDGRREALRAIRVSYRQDYRDYVDGLLNDAATVAKCPG